MPKRAHRRLPVHEVVHKNDDWDQKHKLRLLSGYSSAGLSGIKVVCSCKKSAAMTGTFNFDPETGGALHEVGYDCSGSMPWLGVEGESGKCGMHLRVVQRVLPTSIFR